MQHTKVSEVQCFSRSLVIERFHPAPPPGLKRYPRNYKTSLGFCFVFSVERPYRLKTGILAGHTFPSIGDKTHGRALHEDERMPWAATRAGHREKKASILTLVLPASLCTCCKKNDTWMIAYLTKLNYFHSCLFLILDHTYVDFSSKKNARDSSVRECNVFFFSFFRDAFKFWRQNLGPSFFRRPALAVTKSRVANHHHHHPRAGRLPRAAVAKVTRAWGTLFCFFFNDWLLCLVTRIPSTPRSRWGLDPPPPPPPWSGGRRRATGGDRDQKPLGFVSEWEWQSLKCCAMFVIRGLGCVTPR